MFPESFQIISTDIGVRTKEGDSDPIANNNTVETGLMREVGPKNLIDKLLPLNKISFEDESIV